MDTITADSKPVYCYFGGEGCWTCNDLIVWHKALVAKYGLDKANQIFLDSWNNDTPVVCEQLDCRSFDSAFREYAKANGLFSGLYNNVGIIAQPIGYVGDLVNTTATALSNIVGAGANTAKVLKYVLPTIIIIIAVVGIFYLVKNARNIMPV